MPGPDKARRHHGLTAKAALQGLPMVWSRRMATAGWARFRKYCLCAFSSGEASRCFSSVVKSMKLGAVILQAILAQTAAVPCQRPSARCNKTSVRCIAGGWCLQIHSCMCRYSLDLSRNRLTVSEGLLHETETGLSS